MSSNRLRRRLDEADSATLARLTENFCMIGTPLPALDAKKKDVNEYKPIWQQEARDEQGRRRFHGAFTGGFSAGYFNTVGSKEGWTPSSFRSSRADKAKGGPPAKVQSRPEDFMDEEDLADLRDAKQLGSSQAYADGSDDRARSDPLLGLFGSKEGGGAGFSAAEALDDLIRPAATSLGVQLLKRMGWKEGTGLGPRVTVKKRKRLLALQGIKAKDLERYKGSDDDDDDDAAEEAAKHLFPPPNTALLQLGNKTDKTGLGWKQSTALGDLLAQARSREPAARPNDPSPDFRSSIQMDVDSDGELDVFAGEQDIRSSTLAARPGRGLNTTSGTAPSSGLSDQKRDQAENVWLDGRKVLEGFRIAVHTQPPDAWFAPPSVPKGWKPDPKALWDRHAPTPPTEVASKNAAAASGSDPAALDPKARGSMLGEVRMPGPPPSLSDFLSAKARERLESAATAALPREPAREPPPTPPSPAVSIPPTDPAVARAALHGFIPFGTDPAKQSRYRAYLRSQAERDTRVEIRRPSDQSDEHFQHELREFAKSAAIFRPMSTAMASRFTSGSDGVAARGGETVAPGLRRAKARDDAESAGAGGGEATAGVEPLEEELSPARQAARSGMFGPLTRTVEAWYPVRLLCKRFNVPDPHPDRTDDPTGAAAVAGAATTDLTGAREGLYRDVRANELWEANKRQLQHLAASRGPDSLLPRATNADRAGPASTAAAGSIETLGLGDDERQGTDTTTYVKPSVDIFKAIFASDEEESDEDAVGDEGEEEGAGNGSGMAATATATTKPSLGDPSTAFRPAFVARSKRKAANGESGTGGGGGQGAERERADGAERKRKKDKRDRARGLLTFDLDGEEGEGGVPPLRSVKSKRGKREEGQERGKATAMAAAEGEKGKSDGSTGTAAREGGSATRTNRIKASDLF